MGKFCLEMPLLPYMEDQDAKTFFFVKNWLSVSEIGFMSHEILGNDWKGLPHNHIPC